MNWYDCHNQEAEKDDEERFNEADFEDDLPIDEENSRMKLPPSSHMKNTIKSAQESSKLIVSSVLGINHPSYTATRRSDNLKCEYDNNYDDQ